jgi:hypothetical protein
MIETLTVFYFISVMAAPKPDLYARIPAMNLDRLQLEQVPDQLRDRFNELMLHFDFLEAKTLREQIHIACDVLRREETGQVISYEAIGAFFNMSRAAIHNHCHRPLAINAPGRPRILPPQAIDMIKTIVTNRFTEKKPVSYLEIMDALQYFFQIGLSADTTRHICRTIPGVRSIWGIPMEGTRVEVDPAKIEDFYDELEALIEDVPAAFIFNMDESGCSDWADKREIRVLVPDTFVGSFIHIPVDRNSKRSTLVGAIAADGTALKPMVVVDRVTMETDLTLVGYDSEKVDMVTQPNAFINALLFERWAEEIFFPYVEAQRIARGDYQGPAVLIMDGCSAHTTEAFETEAEARNIKIIFLVPHSSDQTQPLDLVTFSLMKRYYSSQTFDHLPSKQSNQVVKMMGSWIQATPPHLVVSAFMAMGMVPFKGRDGKNYMRIDRSKICRVRGWTGGEPPVVNLGQDANRRIRLPTQ